MKEQVKIKRDYGTVIGFTGLWLVQHRFAEDDKWETFFIGHSKEEAKKFIEDTPEYAKSDKEEFVGIIE